MSNKTKYPPNTEGMVVKEAEETLKQAGLIPFYKYTNPPLRKNPLFPLGKELRVIRQKLLSDHEVELLLAFDIKPVDPHLSGVNL